MSAAPKESALTLAELEALYRVTNWAIHNGFDDGRARLMIAQAKIAHMIRDLKH